MMALEHMPEYSCHTEARGKEIRLDNVTDLHLIYKPSLTPRELCCISRHISDSNTMSSDQWRMQLNNYVQGLRDPATVLSWTTTQTGPKHAPTWEARALINGNEYGRGTGSSQGAAREVAAEQTLKALWAERSGARS